MDSQTVPSAVPTEVESKSEVRFSNGREATLSDVPTEWSSEHKKGGHDMSILIYIQLLFTVLPFLFILIL